ncbi:MAG: phosphoribosylglycinamide formyltransferase [Gemmatimonadaceae bacterium]|nr:phosphoribosylglycinamide formyltransferase [Gemmatimonadaceae bacterium]
MTARIAVLASGGGSNLQALIDHFAGDARDVGTIVWVGSNRADAGALTRARAAGIATGVIVDPTDGRALRQQCSEARADLLVLAGYLKLVPADVVAHFRGRLLNVHPALLPAFGGPGMYGHHVHHAVLAAGAKLSGPTVHFVDEHYDRGAIAAQWPVPVFSDDTESSLAARVLHAEHRLLPRTVAAVAAGILRLGDDGRTVGDVPLPALAHL